MKAAVRIFALLVAVVGLASAAFSSTANHAYSTHMSTAVSVPAPTTAYPLPGCGSTGDCVTPAR